MPAWTQAMVRTRGQPWVAVAELDARQDAEVAADARRQAFLRWQLRESGLIVPEGCRINVLPEPPAWVVWEPHKKEPR